MNADCTDTLKASSIGKENAPGDSNQSSRHAYGVKPWGSGMNNIQSLKLHMFVLPEISCVRRRVNELHQSRMMIHAEV